MGPNAPILPPGGAFGPKLYLRHIGPDFARHNRTACGTKAQTAHSPPALRREKRMEQIMVRKTIELVAVAGLLMLAACNTISGAGKDVSSAGKAVSNAAEDAK